MLEQKVVKRIFNGVRDEFGFPGTTLKICRSRSETTRIDDNFLYACPHQYHDEEDCRGIFRHEFGHLKYIPQSSEIDWKYVLCLNHYLGLDAMNNPHDARLLKYMMNAIYDMFVDYTLHKFHPNHNLLHGWEIQATRLKDQWSELDAVCRGVLGYYTALSHLDHLNMAKHDKASLTLGKKALKIIESKGKLLEKINLIAGLLHAHLEREQ